MPTLNDLANLVESTQKAPIVVDRDRCVRIRHRMSHCKACESACPFDALSVSGNDISISTSLCSACGSCIAVCPTEALWLRGSRLDDVLAGSLGLSEESRDTALFACARIASKNVADPASFSTLPCLAAFDEKMAPPLAAYGAKRILLVDGSCESCKYGACAESVNDSVKRANEVLENTSSACRVIRVSDFPDEMKGSAEHELLGSSRRAFFEQASQSAKDTAISTAKASLGDMLGMSSASGKPSGLFDEEGNLTRFKMPRHDGLLNSIDALGGLTSETIKSRLFGSFELDPIRCNGCGMCVCFCPTGALKRVQDASGKVRGLEFTTCECVQCNLCEDICWKAACMIGDEVRVEDLFEFEPKHFSIGPAQRR